MASVASTPQGNTKTAALVLLIVAGMVGLSFASVPIYRIFCQITGLGGTTQVAEAAPGRVAGAPVITVRFNASTSSGLPWDFAPVQGSQQLQVGVETLAFYEATNTSDGPVTGTATFNVTPLKMGQYFNKIDCFCFTEQTLQPGQTMQMPVSYFIDPAFLDDAGTREVRTITLSYRFFETQL